MGASVVEKVHAGVMILLPLGKSREAIASRQADEPEFTNTPWFLPKTKETNLSNCFDLGP